MPTESLIRQLRNSEIGQIYWANICMQYQLGILNKEKSKIIFSGAAKQTDFIELLEEIRKYGIGDASRAAINALIKQSEPNDIAISACEKDTETRKLPLKLSTVMSMRTFTDHCLSPSGKNALTNEWIRRMTVSGTTEIPPIGSEYQVLQHFYEDGARDQTDIPDFEKFLAPKIQIRTRDLRFWMAGDPQHMPANADGVRDFLGLGYLNPGDALVRLSISRATLLKLINSDIKRPSAFCVNDVTAPRFRGCHSSELSRSSVTHEYGMTANLGGGTAPFDGTQEWICPSITIDAKDIHVELLGIVEKPRFEPNNAQFAAHLVEYGALSSSIYDAVMSEICAP